MIAKKIEWLIKTHENFNKAAFGRKIGTKSGLVHDWLNGKSKPKIEYQKKICEAYGVTLEWLNSDECIQPIINETDNESNTGYYMNFEFLSKKIKTALDESGISQLKLSEEMGIHRNTINNWVAGKNAPDAIQLFQLAGLTQKNVVWFYGENATDVPPKNDTDELKFLRKLIENQQETINTQARTIEQFSTKSDESKSKDKYHGDIHPVKK